jgi:ubiquinone/menaquinone biosynthesis C-methylase UbiE
MKKLAGIGLSDVQAVYSGPEGQLWELIMGEQVHIGGFGSSMDLARRAGIKPGGRGVDLCCCTGGGMRFLMRFFDVARMTGVDATAAMVELGKARSKELGGRIRFVQADVCANSLPDAAFDFVWGEDAWCYVADKAKLIAEAVRLVGPGGVIAFTDWLEGPVAMTDDEAGRFLKFMKFPTMANLEDYRSMLARAGCKVEHAADTGRFSPCLELYMAMLNNQLTYDALRIIGFDQALMQSLGAEMAFAAKLAKAGKIIQGLIVARKPG